MKKKRLSSIHFLSYFTVPKGMSFASSTLSCNPWNALLGLEIVIRKNDVYFLSLEEQTSSGGNKGRERQVNLDRDNISSCLWSFRLQAVLSNYFLFVQRRWKDIPCARSEKRKSLDFCFSQVWFASDYFSLGQHAKAREGEGAGSNPISS